MLTSPIAVTTPSQKQVAFLADRQIAGELIYRSRARSDEPDDPDLLSRFRNLTRVILRDRAARLVTKPGKRVWSTILTPNGETEPHHDVVDPDKGDVS